MMTFVLSFFSTFSSAEEKNSALSPSLMRPSTYRTVKLSVCFFSTITPSLPKRRNHSSASKTIATRGPQRDDGVHTSESKRVGDEGRNLRFARLVRHVIEIARRIGRS